MIVFTTQAVIACAAVVFAWSSLGGWLSPNEAPRDPSQIEAVHVHSEAAQHHAHDAMREAGQAIQQKGQSILEDVKEKSHHTTELIKEKAEDAAYWTADKAHEAAVKAGSLLDRVRQRLTGIVANKSLGSTEIRVLPEDYIVFLSMPGIPRENITVQVARGQLMVWGSHEECVGKGGRRACVEHALEEAFELPEDADQTAITSWMHLQVLIIRIPRKPILPDHVIKVGEKSTLDKILEKVGLEEL